MSLIIDLADAVLADLEEQDFGVVIEWERSYAEWDLELKSAETEKVRGDVVPVFNSSVGLETRGSLLYELTIDIAIRRRFAASDVDEAGRLYKAEIDQLVGVLEAVHKHFAKGSPTNETYWSPDDAERIQAWYVKKHLREWNQFTGIVRLPYKASRDL
jgi:hypothetical protein